jgi:ethanolamine ammonia-lyase large subunit
MNSTELTQTFALANEFKEGDLLVGGTRDDQLRRESREALASLRLGEIAKTEFVDDRITETLHRSLDAKLSDELSRLTVADLKRILVSTEGAGWVGRHRDGLSSEAIAAVVKLMTNDQLATVSRGLFNPLPGKGVTVGAPLHFGSRLQPNSPGDDDEEILLSILEGLAYGCGDVILGLNPASDDLDTIIRLEDLLRNVVERLQLPTRYCVLSDIVKQTTARMHTRVDVGFQSLAGTSRAVVGMVGLEVDGLVDLARGFAGLYFETGQGSAVTNQSAEGVDMVTLEARAYGVARHIRQQTGAWMIVNDVAGFIGPEVFRTGDQLLRACLEDMVMAKLHGITMGLDVCATFHMGIDPTELQRLTGIIVEQAAPAYLMAVAGNADPMLGYLTTSFRQHPRLRRRTKRQIASDMHKRLTALGVMTEDGDLTENTTARLFAIYHQTAGGGPSFQALRDEGTRRIAALRERGFDLGYGWIRDYDDPLEAIKRIEAIYSHAQSTLYGTFDDAVLGDSSPRNVRVRTKSFDRNDYLAHPPTGEVLRDEDAARIRSLYQTGRPRVQIIVSDGLNANAINENLRSVLPVLRRRLAATGHHVGDIDVVIENGRVRAGYHIGALLNAELAIHLIGERPGTGINTMSAYLTYGLDADGRSRWSTSFDHSRTTAVCGINRRGKPPETAVDEITRLVNRMFEERCSGVELNKDRSG